MCFVAIGVCTWEDSEINTVCICFTKEFGILFYVVVFAVTSYG